MSVLPTCMSMHDVCVQYLQRPEESVGSLAIEFRLLGLAMWMLGNETRSSGRAVGALNHPATSQAHTMIILHYSMMLARLRILIAV